jgi:hypothetical protein
MCYTPTFGNGLHQMRALCVTLLGIATVGCGPPTPPDDGYVHTKSVYGCAGYTNLSHILVGRKFEGTLRRTMYSFADPKDPLCWYERTPNVLLLKAGLDCSTKFAEWTFTYDQGRWKSEQTVHGVLCD